MKDEPESGDELESLPAEIYLELHAVAEQLFRRERGTHTLQPTALVHEAWLRLSRGHHPGSLDRTRLVALAARMMRRLLVDHARRRAAAKRGGGAASVTLDERLFENADASVDVLALHEALTELAQLSERQAEIVELRFFGGLTVGEVARAIGVGKTTVENDWRMARAWLTVRLGSGADR